MWLMQLYYITFTWFGVHTNYYSSSLRYFFCVSGNGVEQKKLLGVPDHAAYHSNPLLLLSRCES